MKGMTAEEIQSILGLRKLNERSELLKRQLAQAEALRNAQATMYATPQAQALGSIAGVMKNFGGALRGRALGGELEDVAGEKEAASQKYYNALQAQEQALIEELRRRLGPRGGDMPPPGGGLPGLNTEVA